LERIETSCSGGLSCNSGHCIDNDAWYVESILGPSQFVQSRAFSVVVRDYSTGEVLYEDSSVLSLVNAGVYGAGPIRTVSKSGRGVERVRVKMRLDESYMNYISVSNLDVHLPKVGVVEGRFVLDPPWESTYRSASHDSRCIGLNELQVCKSENSIGKCGLVWFHSGGGVYPGQTLVLETIGNCGGDGMCFVGDCVSVNGESCSGDSDCSEGYVCHYKSDGEGSCGVLDPSVDKSSTAAKGVTEETETTTLLDSIINWFSNLFGG